MRDQHAAVSNTNGTVGNTGKKIPTIPNSSDSQPANHTSGRHNGKRESRPICLWRRTQSTPAASPPTTTAATVIHVIFPTMIPHQTFPQSNPFCSGTRLSAMRQCGKPTMPYRFQLHLLTTQNFKTTSLIRPINTTSLPIPYQTHLQNRPPASTANRIKSDTCFPPYPSDFACRYNPPS